MENNDEVNGFSVGYGKPPKHSQFRKGTSGNRKGRPKGSKNVATIWRNELSARVSIIENGKRRTISKVEAAFKQLANKAASGDIKSINTLIKLAKEFGDLMVPDVQQPTIITVTLPRPAPGEDRSYRGVIAPPYELADE